MNVLCPQTPLFRLVLDLPQTSCRLSVHHPHHHHHRFISHNGRLRNRYTEVKFPGQKRKFLSTCREKRSAETRGYRIGVNKKANNSDTIRIAISPALTPQPQPPGHGHEPRWAWADPGISMIDEETANIMLVAP